MWAAVAFAALLASQFVFRPIRDALILGRPDDIPWMFTATLVATMIASPLWSRLLANRPKRRVVPIAFHVFAVCAIGFAGAVYLELDPLTTGRVFYVWAAVFNLFVVSVFWSLLNDLLGVEVARRLYGPIAAGGTAGTLIGPLLTKAFVSTIGIAGVLVLSALLLEIAVIAARRVRVLGESLAVVPADEPAHAGALSGAKRVAQSPYLLAVVGYVLCTATAATFLYMEQATIVNAAFGKDRVAKTEFFAELDLVIGAGTFVVQTLFASRLLAWLGPGIVLCILPIAQGIGITTVALTPTLTVFAVAQVSARIAAHGLTRPARELLFTVVDREDKYHAKNAIDVVGYRFGDFASSWLHKGLLALGAGASVLSIAAWPLTIVWVALAIGLGRGFSRRRPAQPPTATAREVR